MHPIFQLLESVYIYVDTALVNREAETLLIYVDSGDIYRHFKTNRNVIIIFIT